MKRAYEEDEIKSTNLLVLPSPRDHYIMWLTLMICPEWPREIVSHQIMPHFCRQDIMCYSYNREGVSEAFCRRNGLQSMYSTFSIYYTPLVKLRCKADSITLCGGNPASLNIKFPSGQLKVIIFDLIWRGTHVDITEETTYYTLCRDNFIDSQSVR